MNSDTVTKLPDFAPLMYLVYAVVFSQVAIPLIKWLGQKFFDTKDKSESELKQTLIALSAKVDKGFTDVGAEMRSGFNKHNEEIINAKADIKYLKKELARVNASQHWYRDALQVLALKTGAKLPREENEIVVLDTNEG